MFDRAIVHLQGGGSAIVVGWAGVEDMGVINGVKVISAIY